MATDQLDLFLNTGTTTPPTLPVLERPGLPVAHMADAELIAAIPTAARADLIALMGEAGRRRLAAAVPSLAAVCRRFAGCPVREQSVAIEALAAIGGSEAAAAVARAIVRAEVEGPTLAVAIRAVAMLQGKLPDEVIRSLLHHNDPAVRADACRCVRVDPDAIAVLCELLDDLHPPVRAAAACSLGRMGRSEAKPILARLLDDGPTIDVIEAAASIADDDLVVLLGRLACARPALRSAVLDVLDECHLPLAATVIRGLSRR